MRTVIGRRTNPAPQFRYGQRYGGTNMTASRSRSSGCTGTSGCEPGEVCVAGTCMGWIRAAPTRSNPVYGSFAARCPQGQMLRDGRCVSAFHPPLAGASQRLALPKPKICVDANGDLYYC